MRNFAPILLLLIGSSAFAQIPNSDFENWTNDPVLVDWQTNSAPGTLPPYDPYTVRQSMDAYSGTYCADLFSNGVFKPYMETTFPVSAHPEKLSFYWKSVFAPCVNTLNFPEQDTLSAFVQLLNSGVVVDSGSWEYDGLSTATYALAEIFLTNSATQYDSCRIRFDGGAVLGGCGIAIQSTEFYVDEASITFFPNSIEEEQESKIRVWPNPTERFLNVDLGQAGSDVQSYRITDAAGRDVLTGSVASDKPTVNIGSLKSGVYSISFTGRSKVVLNHRFVVR